jgi:hypothetical protein
VDIYDQQYGAAAAPGFGGILFGWFLLIPTYFCQQLINYYIADYGFNIFLLTWFFSPIYINMWQNNMTCLNNTNSGLIDFIIRLIFHAPYNLLLAVSYPSIIPLDNKLIALQDNLYHWLAKMFPTHHGEGNRVFTEISLMSSSSWSECTAVYR